MCEQSSFVLFGVIVERVSPFGLVHKLSCRVHSQSVLSLFSISFLLKLHTIESDTGEVLSLLILAMKAFVIIKINIVFCREHGFAMGIRTVSVVMMKLNVK